jgi:hypothetical protein
MCRLRLIFVVNEFSSMEDFCPQMKGLAVAEVYELGASFFRQALTRPKIPKDKFKENEMA